MSGGRILHDHLSPLPGGTPRPAVAPFAALGADLRFRLRGLGRSTFNLSLLKYTKLDGFLITCQHSGTHWIRWMLNHAIAHRYGVAPPRYVNVDSDDEIIGTPQRVPPYPHLPRIASSHAIAPYALQWPWLRRLRRPPPYAVVIRDVRDVLISNYEKWRAVYAVPFSRYVAGDPAGRAYSCDIWWYVRFANRWGSLAQRYPNDILVLRYEDFRADPLDHLQRLCWHFGMELREEDLAEGLKVGTKDYMARNQNPGVAGKPIRADGQGSTYFAPQDLGQLGRILHRHLWHDFGYPYFETPRGFQPVLTPPGTP